MYFRFFNTLDNFDFRLNVVVRLQASFIFFYLIDKRSFTMNNSIIYFNSILKCFRHKSFDQKPTGYAPLYLKAIFLHKDR